MFRCLQVEELIENHPEEAFGLIPEEYLNLGANLAEPLARGLTLSYFPGWTGRRDFGPALEASDDPIKREYSLLRRVELSEEKRKRSRFRDGHPFLPPPPLPRQVAWEWVDPYHQWKDTIPLRFELAASTHTNATWCWPFRTMAVGPWFFRLPILHQQCQDLDSSRRRWPFNWYYSDSRWYSPRWITST